MTDLKISQLTPLGGALVAANDELPIVDASASETKKVTPDGLVQAGIRLMPNGSIPFEKIDGATVAVPDGSITTVKLADGSVTTVKLADGAVTDAKITGPISLGKLGNQVANVVLAGPSTGGVTAPSFRPLVAADLPKATSASLGAVSIDTSSGLTVSGAGAVGLSTVATAGTSPVVTYNAYGRITAGRALTGADLPLATASAIGGIKAGSGLSVSADGTLTTALTSGNLPVATSSALGGVVVGPDLSVSVSGELSIANAVTPGTSAKVTYDANGLITAGGALVAADIPNLDASKLVSGTINGALIGGRSITQAKLADYSISYIQENIPSVAAGTHHIGTMWFQESTARLSMWNGNSWMTIGQGALSNQNLRFCGLFDASTGQVTALTQFGVSDGFVVTASIPAAANNLTGAYFVCDIDGNGTSVTPGVTYDAGDWVVCLGTRWERIDTLNGGGGGGGGITTINGNVPIVVTGVGDTRNISVNDGTVSAKGVVQLADGAAVTAGTAGLVVTADQLKTTNTNVANNAANITTVQGNITTIQGQITTIQGQVVDATTTVKGVVRLADGAAITAGTAGRVVTADQLKATNDTVAGHTTSIANNATSITTIQGQITTINGKVVDATTAVKGIVQLADAAAITAGTAGLVVTADQLKSTNDAAAAKVTSVSGTAPIVSSGGTTPAISITAATTSAAGSMSSADKTKLDNATAAATNSTIVMRDSAGKSSFATVTATVFDLASLPALP